MGYELAITRRNAGRRIAEEEWSVCVANHPELQPEPANGPHFVVCTDVVGSPWLDWFDGEIHAKNPDAALIDKLVEIANELNAEVLGEEGELYTSGRHEPKRFQPTLGQRLRAAVSRFARGRRIISEPPPFDVGDRVVDPWGNRAVVTDIDAKASHGAGRITTLCNNGENRTYFFFGHQLELLDEEE